MIYAIHLINKEGYYHNDTHWKNIAYIETNKKYIKLFNKSIETCGYIYSIIDYGENINKKYILDKQEKQHIAEIEKYCTNKIMYII